MEEEAKKSTAETVEAITHRASKGIWQGFVGGLKKSLDEAALFSGGAVGGYLASYFRNRGQQKKADLVEKARTLYAEGKHDEAREIIINSDLFGIGYGDEALMLEVQAFVVQFFIDAGEEALIGPFLDALDRLDIESKRRLALSLDKIDGVEKRGQLLISLARTPGENLAEQIRKHLRIARVELDPKDHPANVFVNTVGTAISTAFAGYGNKVDEEVASLKAKRAARAAKIKDATDSENEKARLTRNRIYGI